jgi:DNA-binding transcriptional LysR family regulator
MDSFGALNVFVQAAELRSFVAAGRALGISSSAVGKAVARLEDSLGVRLFHRSTRSITLTAEGALLLERCRRIFGEIEAMTQELSQAARAPRGRLKVSLPLVGMLLMPPLAAFMRAYPDIALELDFTDRLVDVIEEGFDAVVRTGEPGDSRLMTRTLGTFHHRVVASPDYLARHGTPRAPEDLLAHACLRHRYPSTGKLEPWPLHRDGRALDLDPPTAATASLLEPLIYLAEQGLGVACLPTFAIARQLEDGTLAAILDDHVRNLGTFRVLWPSSRQPSPKLRVFVDFLSENLFGPPQASR